MDAQRRTFVALQPPIEVCAALAQAAQGTLGARPGMRLYPLHDLHLTLAFLGPLSPAALGALVRALDRACLERPQAEIRVTHAGAFPERGRERILWAGLEPADALEGLYDAALAAAREAGSEPVDPERQARVPHITLARVRGPRVAVPDAFHQLRFDLNWTAQEVVVCQTDLRPGATPRYPVAHRAPLRGAALG